MCVRVCCCLYNGYVRPSNAVSNSKVKSKKVGGICTYICAKKAEGDQTAAAAQEVWCRFLFLFASLRTLSEISFLFVGFSQMQRPSPQVGRVYRLDDSNG